MITRGTTNPNRLRRCDRWLAGPQGWRLRAHPGPPVVVDLGYGASPVTAVELHGRLSAVRPDVEVVDARPLFTDASGAPVDGLGDGPYVQLWPHVHGTDAMFFALLRRR